MSTATTAEVVYPRWTQGLRPILLLVGIAAAVAAGVTVVLWSRGPNYSMLLCEPRHRRPGADHPGAGRGHHPLSARARLECHHGAERAPERGAVESSPARACPDNDSGFSMMTKDPGLGASVSSWRTRALPACHGNRACAHHHASLGPVDQSARVHLAVPRGSRPSSAISAAMAVLRYSCSSRPGGGSHKSRSRPIVNLVASSVPDLQATQVTVVTNEVTSLTTPPGSDDSSLREEHLQATQRMEDDYEQPHRAPSSRRSSALDGCARRWWRRSTPRPPNRPPRITSPAARSCAANRNPSPAAAIPPKEVVCRGALTNQPPAAGVAQAPPPNKPAAATPAAPGQAPNAPVAQAAASVSRGPDSLSSQSTKNYEIGRTVAYTRASRPGRLKRASPSRWSSMTCRSSARTASPPRGER